MESVDAKMIRAHEQVETIEREIRDYLSTINIKNFLKHEPTNLQPWLVMIGENYIPPPRLSVLIGECVHNMRGALDNLVCGLARTVNPQCDCKKPRIAFPCNKEEKDWNDNGLIGVPAGAQAIIKEYQPWRDRSGRTPNPLSVLNELSNNDKHRACNFTWAHSRNVGVRVHGNDGRVVDVLFKKPFYLGEVETVPLLMPAAAVIPSARVITTGTFVLSLHEEGIWDDLPVLQILERCFDHVEKVIGKLTPFFRA